MVNMNPEVQTDTGVARETVKLISCLVNSEKAEKELLQALYDEQQIVRANSINCRGYASLFEARSKKNTLPQAHFSYLIEVVVAQVNADTIFDFIFRKAGLDKPGAGVVFMEPLQGASHFSLPDAALHLE
ncbi:P-II family nitrogen regulator [sulfur-oxidizing endosymbiont of Gigantopelta aegis]|uniref:P-II family nitrogen regulator n=1 Tax=sulfur-oxidizing endosymbiont of Gigantopelta aegis TaxID=2794934 RepID=UPI0018DDD276|nr:P-II family nitrogen regulator [sulfur-oxidizing endosymbiont of Gigantopelta aegis]